MTISDFNASLKAAAALFSSNRFALSRPNPYLGSHKDYLNHVVSQNILSKASQLVADLESARTSKVTFQSYLAQKQSELKATTTLRGGIVDKSS